MEEIKEPEKAPEAKAIIPKQEVRPPVVADERGLLMGTNLEEQFRLANYYAKSGLMPRALDTPEKILVAMQYARELKLPMTACRCCGATGRSFHEVSTLV